MSSCVGAQAQDIAPPPRCPTPRRRHFRIVRSPRRHETRGLIQVSSDRHSRPGAVTIERPGEPPHTSKIARCVIDLPDHCLAVAHHVDCRAPRFEIKPEVQIAEMNDLIVAVKPTLPLEPTRELSARQRGKQCHHADWQRRVLDQSHHRAGNAVVLGVEADDESR
jgi:hypothetical protein